MNVTRPSEARAGVHFATARWMNGPRLLSLSKGAGVTMIFAASLFR